MSADESRVVAQSDSELTVSGALTFDSVPSLFEQSAYWLQRISGPVTVDLRDVHRADSAGLALLVEWLRGARQNNRAEIRFTNVPEQMGSLIRVHGLGGAFGLSE